jgi:hypothetical protein
MYLANREALQSILTITMMSIKLQRNSSLNQYNLQIVAQQHPTAPLPPLHRLGLLQHAGITGFQE